MNPSVPLTLRTARLLLRPWEPADAPALLPILEANVAHLADWIPTSVSKPVPLAELAERLARFGSDFADGRALRYAVLPADGSRLLGGADLHPRAAGGRVPLADADRVELGYWLDASATGHGVATEATRALLDVAATLPALAHAEIRCDVGNAPSAAVARRLGFTLARVESRLQVWERPLSPPTSPPSSSASSPTH